MRLKIKGVNFIVDYYFVALLTMMIVVLQKEEILTCFLFCVLHELGHLSAMLLMGEKPVCVELGYFGMRINYGDKLLPAGSDIIVSAAGPAVNIILAIFFGLFGNVSMMSANISLAFFNLLPVKMLDGGRILSHLVEPRGLRVCGIVTGALLVIIGLAVAVISRSNFIILIVSVYVFWGAVK